MKHVKILIISLVALVGVAALVLVAASIAKNYSNADFKNSAAVFLQGKEVAGTPITLRLGSNYYYYVPFEVNKTLNSSFPGMMLDKSAKAITDKSVLKNLFLYPALVKEFSSNIKYFDKLAVSKTAAFAKYCRILEVQKIKFAELNMQGNVAGILYKGTKLAFDAVGLVKSATTGIAALIKDLAKGAVQDSVVSSLTKGDSTEILTNTQTADDSSQKAYKACQTAMNAWNLLQSTTGKTNPNDARNAIEQTRDMFYYEFMAMEAMKNALNKVNNYPTLITKITKKDYQKGMTDFSNFVSKLDNEKKYWNDILTDVNDENMLALWTDEQLSRVASGSQPSCADINLVKDYSLYNYSLDSAPCTKYQENIASGKLSLRCQAAAPKWREHWVKEIDVSGLSKLKITADIGLNDRSRFFTECRGVGVKYDNYADLVVLSADPNPKLRSECNKIIQQSEWSKCSVANSGATVLGHCGVPKCSSAAKCDFTVDVSGKNKLYLSFQINDAWQADIEGTLANLKTCAVK